MAGRQIHVSSTQRCLCFVLAAVSGDLLDLGGGLLSGLIWRVMWVAHSAPEHYILWPRGVKAGDKPPPQRLLNASGRSYTFDSPALAFDLPGGQDARLKVQAIL